MNEKAMTTHSDQKQSTRRDFVQRSSVLAVGAAIASPLSIAKSAHAAGSDTIRIGLVGCGGRGTGAAIQALKADSNTRLVAMADAFSDRLQMGLSSISKQNEVGDRVEVDQEHRFIGFDGYKRVLESDVDVVLLATPPQFRPAHLRACIEAGKHVFAEKPVAVDAPGVRSVLETTELAKAKNLLIVSGLNTRYSFKTQEGVERIHQGAIGEISHLQSVRYATGVWVRPRKDGMTEMEYQMRNWYYFTWLSGDFNVEQFVHQMDLAAWLLKNEYPVRCYGTGGRLARTGPNYGNIYDNFNTVFEYESGARFFATTRHYPGSGYETINRAVGNHGSFEVARNKLSITGQNPWESSKEKETDSHQLEHFAFFKALREGTMINNGEYMAKSTLMAIMARMTAYTGKTLTWEQALNSTEDLSPSSYGWDGIPVEAKVAVPGVTKFV